MWLSCDCKLDAGIMMIIGAHTHGQGRQLPAPPPLKKSTCLTGRLEAALDCLLGLLWVCKCLKDFSFRGLGPWSPDQLRYRNLQTLQLISNLEWRIRSTSSVVSLEPTECDWFSVNCLDVIYVKVSKRKVSNHDICIAFILTMTHL